MNKKIAITGIGMISPLGTTITETWEQIKAGKCGLGEIKSFDASGMACNIGGEVAEYDMRSYLPKYHRKAAKLMSRDIELAVVAADDAFRSSGLGTKYIEKEPQITPERTTIGIGAGLINCEIPEITPSVMKSLTDGKFDMKKWGVDGLANLTPLWLLKYLPNMLACHIGIIHDIQGPGNNITTSECSGMQSVIEVSETIKEGLADVGIAGSGEATVHPISIMRAIKQGRTNNSNDEPSNAVRPFSEDAEGLILSEGAAMVILEPSDLATQRGATIYAELAGVGESVSHNLDYSALEADGQGLAIAIEAAIQDAGIKPEMIDLIIPHGTAVKSNDEAEINALKTVFGESLSDITVFPTKRLLGLMGNACSAVDIVLAAKAMSESLVPGVGVYGNKIAGGLKINTENIEKEIRYALCCCYTPGGQTAAVVLKKGGN